MQSDQLLRFTAGNKALEYLRGDIYVNKMEPLFDYLPINEDKISELFVNIVTNYVKLSNETSVLDSLSSRMREIINFIHVFPDNEIFSIYK